MAETAAKRGARKPRAKTRTQERESPTAMEAAAVTVEIEELTAYNESTNMLLYGPSGHGKTVLAGGAPNATFLSTEKGVVAAKRAGSKAKLMRAPDWEHVLASLDKADETMGPEDWLIVDSHTKMQVLYVRWILRTIHDEQPHRDLDIPAIQDHQKWQNGFKRFTDRIVDAKYNSIFICTTMRRDDEDGEDQVLPAITGKGDEICNYVCAQMDVIGYYAVSEKATAANDDIPTRRALFQPFPPYIAKDRYQALGMYQDVGDQDYNAMAEFIEMIQDSVKTSG
jgi:hypothetical protein